MTPSSFPLCSLPLQVKSSLFSVFLPPCEIKRELRSRQIISERERIVQQGEVRKPPSVHDDYIETSLEVIVKH